MDLRKEISREHSRSQCLKIADYVGNKPARFKALVEVFLEGPYRVTQRAAWPLGICVERNQLLVIPYLHQILGAAKKPGVHDAVKRNTMRLLQYVNIPPRLHGKVLDLSFSFLQNKKEAVAVRVFSMTVINNLAKKRPELQRELLLILEDEFPVATAAFRSRAKYIIKDLMVKALVAEKE
jgi:hypothetical protein